MSHDLGTQGDLSLVFHVSTLSALCTESTVCLLKPALQQFRVLCLFPPTRLQVVEGLNRLEYGNNNHRTTRSCGWTCQRYQRFDHK